MIEQDFTFSHPYMLLYLEIIPIMMFYYFRYYRNQRSIIQISTLTGFQNYQKTFRQKFIHLPFILRTLSIFCLIIAMADPKTIQYDLVRDSSPSETVFLMDISQNALARDFSPNRFRSTKLVLDHFLDKHPGQSYGIITMGSKTQIEVPITDDIQTLKKKLDDLNPDNSSKIHLDQGLMMARQNFDFSPSHHKQIIILLFSDPTLRYLPSWGYYPKVKDSISIYPMVEASEGIASYAQVHNQDTSFIDRVIEIPEKPLMDLADKTDGQFFRSRDNQELDRNFLKLEDNLERLKTRKNPNYQGILPFTWIAAILLVFEILLRYSFLKSLP